MAEPVRPSRDSSPIRMRTERVESARGVVELYHHAHGVIGSCANGELDEPLTRATLAFITRVMTREGPVMMFHDWEPMTGYDVIARQLCTDFVLEHYRMMRGTHMLVRSPIVAMGIGTANLVTRAVGIVLISHLDRGAFEDARRAALSP